MKCFQHQTNYAKYLYEKKEGVSKRESECCESELAKVKLSVGCLDLFHEEKFSTKEVFSN